MSDEIQDKPSNDGNDTLTALIKLAGPSAEIDDGVEDRVYAAVRQEWVRRKLLPQPVRWALPFALAASILIAFSLRESDTVPLPQTVGTVMVAMGESTHAVGDSVYSGDVLDTSNGQGASVALKGDISLRIDAETLLKVDSANEYTLLAGRIYIDTGDRIYSNRHVTVNTASGIATDIGTQFSVRFENADMSVAVREGQVILNEGDQVHTAGQGDKITVRPGKAAQFEVIPTSGEQWSWTTALAPVFDIEDKSLLEFLRWVSRETGLELRMESDELRMEAMRPRLHGSVAGMSPLRALDAIMATTDFEYSIDGGTINISK